MNLRLQEHISFDERLEEKELTINDLFDLLERYDIVRNYGVGASASYRNL